MQLPVELQAALRLEVPCRAFVRSWKQPRCCLTAEEGKGDAERVIGMLLNLLLIKVPPFSAPSFIKGTSCLWIISVSLMFASVETSHTASSEQRMNEASEGMISSRCFYSVLPHSFAGLHLSYLSLFPLAPSLSTPSHQLLFQVLTPPYLCSGPHPLLKSSCCPGILLLIAVGLLPCCQQCMSNASVY